MDYTVQAVDVLGAASDYGTPYNVKFAEEAETAFMLAKKAPVVGEVEHGNITDEPTKKDPSKTYRRFRRQQQEGFSKPSVQNTPKQVDHDSMYRCNALNNAATYVAHAGTGASDPTNDERVDVILQNADRFYAWLKNENKGYEAAKQTAEKLKITEETEEKPDEVMDGEEINLDDIPF